MSTLIPVSTFSEKLQNLIHKGDLNSTNMFDKLLYGGDFLFNSPIVKTLSAKDLNYPFSGGISQFKNIISQAFIDGKPTGNKNYTIPVFGTDIVSKKINAYVMNAKTTLFTESVECNLAIENMTSMSMKDAVIKALSVRFIENLDIYLVNMLKGIGELTTISSGNSTTDYTIAGLETTINLRKERVSNGNFYIIMSFNTLNRIMSVETSLKTASPNYAKSVEVNYSGGTLDRSITTWSNYGKANYLWKNSIRIYTYPGLTDGSIYLIEPDAFHYKPYPIDSNDSPIVIHKNPKADGGLGTEEIIAKFAFMLHPNGFTFDGKLKETAGTATPTYEKPFGLSTAELALANMYKLIVPVEYSPILVYKIKPV